MIAAQFDFKGQRHSAEGVIDGQGRVHVAQISIDEAVISLDADPELLSFAETALHYGNIERVRAVKAAITAQEVMRRPRGTVQ